MFRPFFLKSRKDFAVGEECVCGHSHEQHDCSDENDGTGVPVREFGHGKCCVEGCDCQRFVWARYILLSELESPAESLAKKCQGRNRRYRHHA